MPSTPNAPGQLYSDQIRPIARSNTREVFFLSIEAYPEPGSDLFGNVGGAYIHCYLAAEDLRTAESQAITLLQEREWRPHRLEGWEITSEKTANRTIRDDSGCRQCDLVRKALEEQHALVFYCWDIAVPDARS